MNKYDYLTKNQIINELLDDNKNDNYTICEFDKKNNIFIVEQNGRYGIINTYGKVILPTFFAKEKLKTLLKSIKEPVNPLIYDTENVVFDKFKEITISPFDKKFDTYIDFIGDVAIVIKNNKYGLINKNFELILDAVYDKIVSADDDIFCIYQNEKWGFADSFGQILIEPKYLSYGEYYNSYFKDVDFDGNKIYLYINRMNKKIKLIPFDNVYYMNENVAPVLLNYKWGYIKNSGELICKPQYDEVNIFSGGMGIIKKDSLYGFVDLYGQEKIPCQFEDESIFKYGYAAVKQNGKWGFIDAFGKIVVECVYDYVSDFVNGFARIRQGIYNNVLNINMKKIFNDIPVFIREYVSDSFDDYMIIKEKTKDKNPYSYIYLGNDKSRPTNINNHFQNAFNFDRGFARVCLDNKYGIINQKGSFCLPCIFSTITSFNNNGIAEYTILNEEDNTVKTGFILIQEDNKTLSIMPYNTIESLGQNIYKVSSTQNSETKYGLVDSLNRILVPIQFASIDLYYDKKYTIYDSSLSKYKVVDISDIQKPNYSKPYDEIHKLSGNIAIIKNNGKYGYCNKNFKELIDCIFDEAFDFYNNFALINKDNMLGYINSNGAYTLLPYDDISYFENGYAIVAKNGKETVIDTNFNELLDKCYDKIIKIDIDKLLLLDITENKSYIMTFKCKDIYSNYKISDGIYFMNDCIYANDNILFEINTKIKIQNYQFEKSIKDTTTAKNSMLAVF